MKILLKLILGIILLIGLKESKANSTLCEDCICDSVRLHKIDSIIQVVKLSNKSIKSLKAELIYLDSAFSIYKEKLNNCDSLNSKYKNSLNLLIKEYDKALEQKIELQKNNIKLKSRFKKAIYVIIAQTILIIGLWQT